MYDIRPQSDVNRIRNIQPGRLDRKAEAVVRSPFFRQQSAKSLAQTFFAETGAGGGVIQHVRRIRRHAERAVFNLRGHVFRSATAQRQLGIVDGGGAVRREMRDKAVFRQIQQKRNTPALDDVTAEHGDHGAAIFFRLHDRRGDFEKVFGLQDVRKAEKEFPHAHAVAVGFPFARRSDKRRTFSCLIRFCLGRIQLHKTAHCHASFIISVKITSSAVMISHKANRAHPAKSAEFPKNTRTSPTYRGVP